MTVATPAAALLAALSCVLAAPPAQACTPAFKGAPLVESPRYLLAWRAQPAAIAVGRHFAIDFVVCAKAGASQPQSLRVDAQMPEHRHGMNYKAVVSPVAGEGAGRYRAEGLMFHMAGRWELSFELRGTETERLTAEVTLR
jgi:hypothetical protein